MKQAGFAVPIVIALVVIVTLGAGIYYFATSDRQVENTPLIDTENTAEQAGDSNPAGKLTDLVKMGERVTCTFSQEDSAGTTQGTVYNSGDNLRVDFELKQTNGESFEGHIIRDSSHTYTWSSLTPQQGVKISNEIEGDNQLDIPQATSTNTDQDQDLLNQEVGYNCSPWNVDESKFVLPPGISFQDATQNFQQLNQQGNSPQETQCAACAQLEGIQRTQCEQALGC